MKKKYSVTSKDKKDWITFTKQLGKLHDKDFEFRDKNININKVQRLDLHGFSLNEANRIAKEFIIESSKNGSRKLLIVTGKGLRSKVYNDPYRSEKMNVLRYAVPEYIKNDEDLSSIITKISQAELKDGGEGAIYIFLKKNNL